MENSQLRAKIYGIPEDVYRCAGCAAVKEIFDDSGTLPVGKWLHDLCHQIIKRGLNKKVTFGCNMRFGALTQKESAQLTERKITKYTVA